MKIKFKLGRRRVEGVVAASTYPEPWPIGNVRWMRFLYRALLGRPMDNVRWTNSTFFRSASSGEASVWLRLAGWHRALIRVVGAWLLMLTLPVALMLTLDVGRSWALTLIYWHVVAVSAPLLMLDHYFRKEHGQRVPWRMEESESTDSAPRKAWRMVSVSEGRRSWIQEKVLPLALAMSAHIDNEMRPADAPQWVSVPRNYLDPAPKGGQIEILLPRSFAPKDPVRSQMERTVREKLGMSESAAVWQLSGRHPRLLMSTPPAPPASLTFADVERFLRECPEFSPLIGMISEQKSLKAEMQDESPHILLSGGPGSGKSTLMKLLMMQVLHWGWGVVILDWKQTEAFKWAIGLPGVTYITRIEDIHDFGVRCSQEIDSRKNEGMEGKARVLVVRDEWNAVAPQLLDYWSNMRSLAEPEDKKLMTLRSPALQGFAQLDFAGREFGMHDLLAGQKVSNRVFNGNTDMRECFGIRGIARYTEATKRMLVGNMKPFPKASNHPGRWTIVAGDNVAVCQVPLITGEEARAYSQEGKPNPVTPFSSTYFLEGETVEGSETIEGSLHGAAGVKGSSTLEDQLPPGATGGNETRQLAVDKSPAPMLRKLVDIATTLEYLEITHKMLRHAVDRDESFPGVRGGNQFSGYLYDLREVTEWAKRKRAAEAAEKGAKVRK